MPGSAHWVSPIEAIHSDMLTRFARLLARHWKESRAAGLLAGFAAEQFCSRHYHRLCLPASQVGYRRSHTHMSKRMVELGNDTVDCFSLGFQLLKEVSLVLVEWFLNTLGLGGRSS